MIRAIFKFLVIVFAITLILIGIIVAPSPIPFGLVFFFIGFFLLAATAPDVVRWLRRRWRWLDRRLKKLEARLPHWLANILRRSDVEDDEDRDDEDGKN